MNSSIRLQTIAFLITAALLSSGAGSNSIESTLKKGDLALERGEPDIAVQSYRNVLSRNPSSLRALLGTAKSYRLMNDPARAEEYYREILQKDPSNLEAKTGLARVLTTMGRFTEARRLLDEVEGKKPGSISNNLAQGQLYASTGHLSVAMRFFEKVLRKDPFNLMALISLASLKQKLGDEKQATKLLERATRIAPDSEVLQLAMARHTAISALEQKPGKRKAELLGRAIEKHQELLSVHGATSSGGRLLLDLARLHLMNRDYENARVLLENYVQSGVNNPVASYILGMLYSRAPSGALFERSEQKAMGHYRQALQASPEDPIIRFALESLLIGNSFTKTVAGDLKKELSSTHRELMLYNKRIGRMERSGYHMHRALLLDPGQEKLLRERMERARIRGDYPSFLSDLIEIARMKPEDASTQFRLESALKNRNRSMEFKEGFARLHPNGVSFTYDRTPVRVFVFDFSSESKMPVHPDGGNVIAKALRYRLSFPGPVGVVDEATREDILKRIRLAKDPMGSDEFINRYAPGRASLLRTENEQKNRIRYVVQGTYTTTGSDLTVQYEIIERFTGRVLKSFRISDSGREALMKVSARAVSIIQQTIPRSGQVIHTETDGIYVNLGRIDGIQKGDLFVINAGDRNELVVEVEKVTERVSRGVARGVAWYEISEGEEVSYRPAPKEGPEQTGQ